MGQALAQQQQGWPDVINAVMVDFNRIAENHKLVRWREESEFALQSVFKSNALQKCNPRTVQDAIKNVAACGLTLNPVEQYAYLVPRNGECHLTISFKGLLKVAADSGAIQWVKAEVVKENDTFELRGITEEPLHKRSPFSDRGNTVGAYCVAKLPSGEYLTEVISESELMQIRNAASTKAVWDAWPDEMRKKSVIKRASKQWIKSDTSETLQSAVHVLNETEGSDPAYLVFTPEQGEEFNRLVDHGTPLEFLAFIESLSDDRETNCEIYGELTKFSKEPYRESKTMGLQGDIIKELHSQGWAEFRADHDDVLDWTADGDLEAVKSVFEKYKALNFKRKFWDSFNQSEQAMVQTLTEAA